MAGLRGIFASVTLIAMASGAQACEFCSPPSRMPSVPRMPMMFAPAMSPSGPLCPCEDQPKPTRFACPSPAPASPGPGVINEPPLAKPASPAGKGPTIYQNRVFSGVPQITEPRTALCKVSFWNLKGTDLTIAVGDRTHVIPRDRAMILELPRSFTWRVSTLEAKTEDVPDDLNHFEVMIK